VTVFAEYARYYDLLYRGKKYQEEALYAVRLIKAQTPKAKSILELGCGTGAYAKQFAGMGFDVHGVDISEVMIECAREESVAAREPYKNNLSFHLGDIRSIRLEKRFDAVVSLFHVISYQPTDYDLLSSFETARLHMEPGGIFLFDCWYGPAVLTDRPSVQVKRVSNDKIEITRIAEPVMHPNDNIVDVNYHLFIRDKSNNQVEEVREQHRMRYLFKPEVESMLRQVGLKMVHFEEWFSGAVPGCTSWNVVFLGAR
jgi:SAM-dependent methyltransferase